jgi:Tfp pilus assembly protein PilN
MPMQRINLLPPEERRKASRERGLMYALLFLIFVVAVLGVLYVFENQRVSTRNQEVATQQVQLDAINAEVAKLKPFEALQSQRASMNAAASTIVDSRVIWSSIFEEVSLLIPDAVRLNSLTAAVPPNMLAGAAAGGAASGAADITFAGQAASHKDVADFMTRLGLMPQIMNIQLVSAAKGAAAASSGTGSAAAAPSLVAFQITAQLRPFETSPSAAAAAPTTTIPASGQ